ncbi:M48 family metallopeptidase [Phytohabitans sp. ZYX-F-186]|uniref:M48 family metallopeptidase n=1 Tax=Phytohabitans maris TaxID=3071409 RepID=A0ABU0ZKC0_9ACTN|nr:M48 family metallopeptidase [Phytohabitans sp. ZYX-F-186]MDQ7906827.1 M48 family metallopeptidase [Phytohabitans sp. ZYX-F-186]
MVAAVRAGASVLMLAGFYIVALVQVAAAIAFGVWLSSLVPGGIALKIIFPVLVAAIGSVAVGLWKAVRAKPKPPEGLSVGPDQAPELWRTVHELAHVVGTRVPNEIRLVPEVNAAVFEDSRLLGLVGGRRTLYIGLPLLQAFTVDQLRAVLAHELGHYSHAHTRLGAIAYRGRLAIGGTVGRIGPYNVAGWVFKGYARLYLLVDNASSRRQELEADQAAVRAAGRAAAASALREVPVVDAAWGFYFRRYVEPGWESGYAPDDLFGGFAELIAARKDELDELRGQEPPSEGSVWDTHPPIAERIGAIAATPEVVRPPDGRRAGALLPDLGGAGRAMQGRMLDVGERQVLPWAYFTAATATTVMQRDADAVFRAIGRTVGTNQLNLAALLDIAEANRLGTAAESLFPDATRREVPKRFVDTMAMLIALAAVRSNAAYWQHSWTGPARLVGRDGQPLPTAEIAARAVSPQTVGEARAWLAHLGIDPGSAAVVEQRASATGAGVIAAIANVKVDGVEHDLVVLDKGLVFVGNPGKSDKGKVRLEELVGSAPADEIAKRHRFLPYEEIASVAITKNVPLRADLTLHSGQMISVHEAWSSELIAKNSRDVLADVLKQVSD